MILTKIRNMLTLKLAVFITFIVSLAISVRADEDNKNSVTYDGRSLIINGRREILFSGSIHYPRSTPDMWPEILDRARHGGLNVIQTYVFWNIHEPEEGKFKMEGDYDLVKFLKLVQEKGMYATLRVGPFIQAEWNHGGLPFWLREVPGIIFRSNNDQFKINACNGRHCGDTFTGPNKPYKPSIWTENWTAHHLKDVHKALNLCKKALLTGTPSSIRISPFHEIIVFERQKSNLCAAFITNNHTKMAKTVNFRGTDYYLPPRSISILPDCKTVVFNTQHIVSQHNSRNFVKSKAASNLQWAVFSEYIPTTKQLPPNEKIPLEVYTLLRDTTDYAWFTTSVELGPEDLPKKNEISPVIRIMSLGHSLQCFVNGEYIGSNHGSHEEKAFEFQKRVSFKVGVNHIAILSSLIGLPDSGAYMEHRFAGPKTITILGLNSGKIDLTANGWGHQVGLQGEKLSIFTSEGSQKVGWKEVKGAGPPISWYKTNFATPEGREPVAVHMNGMAKGMIWVNGRSIGRHWMSYLSPLGKPTQSEYHIPRSYLNPKDNLLVIFEEENASPDKVEILIVNRDTVCSLISENHPPNVKLWASKQQKLQTLVDNPTPQAIVKCPNQKTISAVEFASFGDPSGACGAFIMGKCNAPDTKKIVEKHCLGKVSCSVPMNKEMFINGNDPCPDVMKELAIQVKCDS
ncbi:Glycoside hydrolase, family 35 [Sesbania bispinosa]|nr:Glycoside hydrolase, family 35 [Sesbania bispinosa]